MGDGIFIDSTPSFLAVTPYKLPAHQIRSTWNKCVNQALTSRLVHIFPE